MQVKGRAVTFVFGLSSMSLAKNSPAWPAANVASVTLAFGARSTPRNGESIETAFVPR